MVVVSLVGSPVVDDEADLVLRAQHDRRAFADLYRQYLPQIYRYCYRRLGSQEAAEDATSRIFTQALVALPRYQQRSGSFRAWLFTIAHHTVVDEARRARPVSSLDETSTVLDPGPPPEDVVIRSEEGQSLAAVMAHLTPDQRRVVELRLAGLTAVEIAAVMGRSHGTIRNLHHRALVRLRHLFEVRTLDEGGRDGS
jgi:RNA polymerase sigma-70 factor (ECF subfamily)